MWSGSAVRAILTNPRYLGHQVVGRQRRRDELVDPADPAAGTASRQRWQAAETWVTSDEPAWPALVDVDLWERVSARITNTRGPQRRRPRATAGVYLLAGLVRCKVCGRCMHGATLKGKPYDPCNPLRPDYADTGHPRTTAFREDRILAVLDRWLNQFTDGSTETIRSPRCSPPIPGAIPEPAPVKAAQRALRELPAELDRVLAAIRAGWTPPRRRDHQPDPPRAHRRGGHDHDLEAGTERAAPLTAADIHTALDHAGDLAGLLHRGEAETRTRLYRALDLELLLDPVGDPPTLDVRLQLCGGGGRI